MSVLIRFVCASFCFVLSFIQLVALVVGVIFFGQTLSQDGVMNINGALFLFLTNMTFQNVLSVANVSQMDH